MSPLAEVENNRLYDRQSDIEIDLGANAVGQHQLELLVAKVFLHCREKDEPSVILVKVNEFKDLLLSFQILEF